MAEFWGSLHFNSLFMKRFILFIGVIAMVLLDNGSFAQSFSGGNGTLGNPYQITTKAELLTVKDYSSKHYILMNDIDFTGEGPYGSSIIPIFGGRFNGNGHQISNLILVGVVSFFGEITNTSFVYNLHLRKVSYDVYTQGSSGFTTNTNNQYHAPFAQTNNGTIASCSYQSSSAIEAYCYLSGFVRTNNGIIKNCYSNTDCSLYWAYNNSMNWFTGQYATGFVFTNNATGIIENCYYAGTVNSGRSSTAGFVYENGGTIKNSFCLATAVNSPDNGGQTIRRMVLSNSGTLTNNYARAEMTLNGAAISSSDASSVESKDIAGEVLNQQQTFTDQGWCFVTCWMFESGAPLPTLRLYDMGLLSIFNTLNAHLYDNQLRINWSVLNEIHCSHYDIEVSGDGKVFKKVGSVSSKSQASASSGMLDYDFAIPTGSLALGIALFALASLMLHNGGKGARPHKTTKMIWIAGFIFLMLAILVPSCRKNDVRIGEKNKQVFVRIAQVDKDGSVNYSKVVMVGKE